MATGCLVVVLVVVLGGGGGDVAVCVMRPREVALLVLRPELLVVRPFAEAGRNSANQRTARVESSFARRDGGGQPDSTPVGVCGRCSGAVWGDMSRDGTDEEQRVLDREQCADFTHSQSTAKSARPRRHRTAAFGVKSLPSTLVSSIAR